MSRKRWGELPNDEPPAKEPKLPPVNFANILSVLYSANSDSVLSEVHSQNTSKKEGDYDTSTFQLDSSPLSAVPINIDIRHKISTNQKDVGLQVWRGSFIFVEYVLANFEFFSGLKNGLELGAGNKLGLICKELA